MFQMTGPKYKKRTLLLELLASNTNRHAECTGYQQRNEECEKGYIAAEDQIDHVCDDIKTEFCNFVLDSVRSRQPVYRFIMRGVM